MASLTQWTWVWVDSGSPHQGGLACYGSWGHRELDITEQLNWKRAVNLDILPTILRVFCNCQEKKDGFRRNLWNTKFRFSSVKYMPGMQGKWVWDADSIPELQRSHGERNDNPLQYCYQGNPLDGGAWQATVHGFAESDTTERVNHHHHGVETRQISTLVILNYGSKQPCNSEKRDIQKFENSGWDTMVLRKSSTEIQRRGSSLPLLQGFRHPSWRR